MRLEIKRNSILIIPESDMDNAFIENTLKVKTGEEIVVEKVADVKMGFKQNDNYVLKIKNKNEQD